MTNSAYNVCINHSLDCRKSICKSARSRCMLRLHLKRLRRYYVRRWSNCTNCCRDFVDLSLHDFSSFLCAHHEEEANKLESVELQNRRLVASIQASRNLNQLSMADRHEQWMAKHGIAYKDATEKALRYEIFKSNVERVEAFNAENHKYKLGVNKFADLTNDEFKARNGFKRDSSKVMRGSKVGKLFRFQNVSAVPSSMDWRKLGAVTPVKDQGQCGCCWAFSAVAATEGINKLTTGKLISLSEQELVYCDVYGEDQGCDGGLMDDAFKYIIKSKGLTTESNYPYKVLK